MAYTKFTWTESTDSEITSARLNNLESQHELALVDARAASSNPLHAQIVSSYPTHGTGKLIYHTGEGKFFASNGTVWLPVATPPRTGHVTGQSHSRSGTTLRFRPETGYYPGDAGNSVQMTDANFVEENIKEATSIFGLTGTFNPVPFWREVVDCPAMTSGNTYTIYSSWDYVIALAFRSIGTEDRTALADQWAIRKLASEENWQLTGRGSNFVTIASYQTWSAGTIQVLFAR